MSGAIDIGALSEALNNKMDLDIGNMPTSVKTDITGWSSLNISRYTQLAVPGPFVNLTAPATGYVSVNLQATNANGVSAPYWFALYIRHPDGSEFLKDFRWYLGGTDYEYGAILPVNAGDLFCIAYDYANQGTSCYQSSWNTGIVFLYDKGID